MPELTEAQAMAQLVRLCESMGGTMAADLHWFDTPHDRYTVGWGIVSGEFGWRIVSVPR